MEFLSHQNNQLRSKGFNQFEVNRSMAKKGGIGGKKDRVFINNVIANGKEDSRLSSKLANLELQKHKEMVRWDTEKNKLSLPSLKTNGGISLTPPSSPTMSPTRMSPVVQRRRSDLLNTEPAARFHGNNQMIVGTDVVGLRRSKSSQNIRLSVGPKPPPTPMCRSPGALSPRLLHRRSTISQSILYHDEGNALKQANMGRRFSAGVVPSIRVEESADALNEKVKKFNESMQKFSKEVNQSKNSTTTLEDDTPTTDDPTDESTDELLIPPRPIAHRWKSLPNIFPMLGSDGKSPEEMTFYEDMKRCRYLRIPDLPTLNIEQIFDKNSKQTKEQK